MSNVPLFPSFNDPRLGLYPGSDNQYNGLFSATAQSVVDLNNAAPTMYSGAAWDTESYDVGDESSSTMYQALNMQGGGDNSARAMNKYVEDSNASDFETDVTSLAALARNARYADQVGNL